MSATHCGRSARALRCGHSPSSHVPGRVTQPEVSPCARSHRPVPPLCLLAATLARTGCAASASGKRRAPSKMPPLSHRPCRQRRRRVHNLLLLRSPLRQQQRKPCPLRPPRLRPRQQRPAAVQGHQRHHPQTSKLPSLCWGQRCAIVSGWPGVDMPEVLPGHANMLCLQGRRLCRGVCRLLPVLGVVLVRMGVLPCSRAHLPSPPPIPLATGATSSAAARSSASQGSSAAAVSRFAGSIATRRATIAPSTGRLWAG